MRRRWPHFALVSSLVLLLALPATAGVRRPKPTEGTLSVRDGVGMVQITARGTVIGRIASGQVVAVDRSPDDDNVPVVRGGRVREVSETTVVRAGRNVRFRLAGGSFRLKIRGTGIDLAAVGRGSVMLNGDERFADTGLYSLNGEDYVAVPYQRTTLALLAEPGD